MPDKKLTDNLSNNSPILSNGLSDNEIKKALECCATGGTDECQNCSYVEKYPYCDGDMEKDLIDLINRLQADCENYKQIAEHQQSVTMDRGFEIKRLKEKIESLQAENERLSQFGGILLRNGSELFKEIQTAKVEAVTEFAERLREKIKWLFSMVGQHSINEEIDNLLKEMVGENQ